MKIFSLLLCIPILLLFGFHSYAQTVTISSGLTSDTVCSGTTINFTATPSPSSGSYGYIWNLNGSYVGTSAPAYTTSTLISGINTIYCTLTDASGSVIYSISDTLTITVDTLPVNSPITGPVPTSVCIGDTISLSDASTGGTWASSNTAAASVSVTGVVTGISLPAGGGGLGGPPSVRIYYIMTNNCGSDSSHIRVSIAAPPSPITLANSTVCIDSFTFITDSAGGGSWSVSNAAIGSVGFQIGEGFPPAFGEAFTGITAGTTTIYFNDTNSCGVFIDSAAVTVIDCSSTSTAVPVVSSISNSCSIYPNPSAGAFNITANSSKYNQAQCTISNLVGEQIKDFTISTNQETPVNLGMPTGIYFITVSAGEEKYTSKIIIMQ